MYMKKNVILLWAIIMPMISWAQARSTILSEQPEGTVLTDRVWSSDGYAVDEAQARWVPFKEKDRDRKSTRLNSSHITRYRMPSSA